MKHLLSIISVLAGALLLSGCATAWTRGGAIDAAGAPYLATRIDCSYISGALSDGEVYHGTMSWWERPMFLLWFGVDLPISLVMDTVCLPVDLYQRLKMPQEGSSRTEE